jgi:N-acetylneuraminate synthase
MFFISEIGQAHDGSLGILHSYIDAIAGSGVQAIKFQTHIPEAESSIYEPFRVKFSFQDQTRFDYWKRMSFTKAQWKEIKKHCDDVGLEFMSSPFSIAAIDLLEDLDVCRYKVGSGEVSNLLLIDKLIQTKKPIIISSGMSSFAELDVVIDYLKIHNVDFSILQCTTSYPTRPDNWGLNVIGELKDRYNVPVGFSDHSGDIFACLAASALGAEILEFHVVFDKRMFGPDTSSSIIVNDISKIVKGATDIANAINNPVDKRNNSEFKELKSIFEKSLAINGNFNAGHILSLSDLEAKKPKGYGIDAKYFKDIIGKKLIRDMKQWDFLNYNDLLDE